MKWPPALILPALKQTAWPILTGFFRPDCCIAATRIGIDVLARFGIHGQAMATLTMAQNASFKGWHDAGAEGEPPADARFVIIDHRETRDNGFPGHLIITGKTQGRPYILDLSAPQMHRPQKNILIPDPLLMYLPRPWNKEEGLSLPLENGGWITYEYHPDPRLDWTTSKDWSIPDHRRQRFETIKAKIIEAVEARVNEARSPGDLVREPLGQP